MLLAGCGDGLEVRSQASVEGLDTFVVAAAEEGPGRSWDGVVKAVRQATLSAQTTGRVVEVYRDIHDRVAEGEPLLQITDVEQQSAVALARAEQAAAEATLAEAESSLRRLVELAAQGHVSRAQLDQVRAHHDAARAHREAARARLASARQQSEYTLVRAPYAAVISQRLVEPGETVAPGQPLMALHDPSVLRLETSLPQRYAERVRQQPEAAVVLEDGRRLEADRVIVYPSADPATHALRVRVELAEPDSAPVPGTTARVVFPAITGAALPHIPVAAVVVRGELQAVYVVRDGQVVLRQLRLGHRQGDQVAVLSGLREGDEVALDPVAALEALSRARGGG